MEQIAVGGLHMQYLFIDLSLLLTMVFLNQILPHRVSIFIRLVDMKASDMRGTTHCTDQ